MRSHEFLFAILVAAPLLLSGGASEAQDLRSVIEHLGGGPCTNVPDTDMSDFTCVERPVPIDHNASGGGTIKVEYEASLMC